MTLSSFGPDRKAYETLKDCVNELADLKRAASQCKDVTTLDTITERFFELEKTQPSALIHHKEIEEVNRLLAKNISSTREALLTQYSTVNKSSSVFQSVFSWAASVTSKEPSLHEKLLEKAEELKLSAKFEVLNFDEYIKK